MLPTRSHPSSPITSGAPGGPPTSFPLGRRSLVEVPKGPPSFLGQGYWGGPSPEEIFGDRILSIATSPYRLLGVFAVRAKETIVPTILEGETEGGITMCLLSAAARCLPRPKGPPRGLLAKPLTPGILDACCSKGAPYIPPLYASRAPPVSYPVSKIEDDNVRIVSQLEDYLKETARLSILRPPWDRRTSPYLYDRAYMQHRRMQKQQEQQQEQQRQEEEGQPQQQQQKERRRQCAFPVVECIRDALGEVSIQQDVHRAKKRLTRFIVPLLASRERKRIRDFWKLKRQGQELFWSFEGMQIQDLDVIYSPSSSCLLLVLLLLLLLLLMILMIGQLLLLLILVPLLLLYPLSLQQETISIYRCLLLRCIRRRERQSIPCCLLPRCLLSRCGVNGKKQERDSPTGE